MLTTLLILQALSSRQVLDAFATRIRSAQTLGVTVVELVEEFPKPRETRWWYRKGGYYRAESAARTVIGSPTRCWMLWPSSKRYQVSPGTAEDLTVSRITGLGDFGDPTSMPSIGDPKSVVWHGRRALRIEVDGTKTMTKETKLYFLFDPKTLDQVGVSANLGSMTQVRIYKNLKLNPKLDPSLFRFVPAKGWKLVKG